MTTMPTRIDGDLFEAAKRAGKVHSRSAAQQLGHWARIGRELESSPSVSHDMVDRVLTGRLAYDGVDDHTQAVVRAEWDDRISRGVSTLDLTPELQGSGLSWAEADADGSLVVHEPGRPAT